MVEVTREISKEDYERAKIDGARSLITNQALLCGYGVYGARVYSCQGRYYLNYERGSSCD